MFLFFSSGLLEWRDAAFAACAACLGQDHPQGGVYVKDLSAFVVKNTEEMHQAGVPFTLP